jgi:hypothetical protein
MTVDFVPIAIMLQAYDWNGAAQPSVCATTASVWPSTANAYAFPNHTPPCPHAAVLWWFCCPSTCRQITRQSDIMCMASCIIAPLASAALCLEQLHMYLEKHAPVLKLYSLGMGTIEPLAHWQVPSPRYLYVKVL